MSSFWYEATIDAHSSSAMAYDIDVSDAGLSSPSVSSSSCDDITDADSIASAAGVLSGSAAITTALWTTPIITPAAADKRYRVTTLITDGSNTVPLVLIVNVRY